MAFNRVGRRFRRIYIRVDCSLALNQPRTKPSHPSLNLSELRTNLLVTTRLLPDFLMHCKLQCHFISFSIVILKFPKKRFSPLRFLMRLRLRNCFILHRAENKKPDLQHFPFSLITHFSSLRLDRILASKSSSIFVPPSPLLRLISRR